jgi:hypothetical protein
MNVPSTHNIIIAPGTSTKQNSVERTPEAVAVDITKQGDRDVFPGPSSFPALYRHQTLGAYQGAKPPAAPYLDYIANVVQSTGLASKCPGYVVTGECTNGHQFAKEVYCGREWCSVCGADDSPAHLRRFARWIPKAQQLGTMGYLVFTIPESERYKYRSKASLNYLVKRITAGDKSQRIEGVLKAMGFDRGMVRVHFFGDTPGKWNPHINVILDAGHIEPMVLELIKVAWAGILGVDAAVVHYSFTTQIPKMVHILKYVTRATFKEYHWDEYMAGALYNFRNMRTWGKWDGAAVWQMLPADKPIAAVTKLEAGTCPVCGASVSWVKARDIAYLKAWAREGIAHPLGAGYWQLDTS